MRPRSPEAASPCGAGRPDEGVVEWVTGEVADFAAVPRRQRHPVESVGSMPCDISESGVLVDAEVIGVIDRGDELRRAEGTGGPYPPARA